MSVLPIVLDKTDKDFDSLNARLRNLIRSVFSDWTEESIANFGNILAEMVCNVGDVLGYYGDKSFRESRITTAELRRSLLGLVKLVGYKVQGASAATTDEVFSLSSAAAGSVTIPAGSIVKTEEITSPIKFQLLADLVFSPGVTSLTGTVEHSLSFSEQFVTSPQGQPNQRFRLQNVPYLDGSLQFAAGNGAYTVVDNFLDSKSTDKHCVVLVDANGRATIITGNGINGTVPSGTATAAYKTGGGSSGELEENTLKQIEGAFQDSLGNPVTVSVNNPQKASGGLDRQTNASIKQNAPKSLRVLSRCVAREDYEIAAKTVTGVVRALFVTSNQDAAVQENTGFVFLVPAGGGAASSTVIDAVAALYARGGRYPAPNTLKLFVKTAPYSAVDVLAVLFRAAGVTPAKAGIAVRAALGKYFAIQMKASDLLTDDPKAAALAGVTAADGASLVDNPRIDFGYNFKKQDGSPAGELAYSDLFNVVRDVPEIRKVGSGAADFLVNGLRADAAIGNFSFPILGTVSLVDGDTGLFL